FVEQPCEVVVPARFPGHFDTERAKRKRVDRADEPRADDPCAHQRDRWNIFVSTSMSSRAPSGGVRHSAPSVMQAWKCFSSRENDSSYALTICTSSRRPFRRLRRYTVGCCLSHGDGNWSSCTSSSNIRTICSR